MFDAQPSAGVRELGQGTEEFKAVRISAFGVRIQIRAPAEILAHIHRSIVPGAEFGDPEPADATISVRVNESASGQPLYEIRENSAVLGTQAGLQATMSVVESWTQLTVATLAKELVFVHAGVVGWRNKAIVIPGRSLSGKSTLVLALVKAGADYYSDEYAMFDSEGRVHPYWRLPKLKAASGQKAADSSLGGVLSGPPPRPTPLGSVLICRYKPEEPRQPRRLTCGETLLGLLDNTVPLRLRPEQAVRTLSRAVANAQGFEAARGEAEVFARQVLSLFDRT